MTMRTVALSPVPRGPPRRGAAQVTWTFAPTERIVVMTSFLLVPHTAHIALLPTHAAAMH